MKAIKNLTETNDGRVYVYLANDGVGNRFMRQAEAEGFTFADGEKPTGRDYAEIMAVNDDGTINYVGFAGRMAFGSGADTVGGRKLIRVDYAKYEEGEDDFIIRIKHE